MTSGWFGRRAVITLVGVCIAVVLGATAAYAVWTAQATGAARAVSDTLGAGKQPTGSASGSNVSLTWAAASTATGSTIGSYTVTRYAAATGGTGTAATGSCAGTVSALTCTENGVADGTWYYAVTPRVGSWTGIEGPRSSALVVATVAAPAAPGTPVLAAASDSGASSSDRVTKVTAPTFTGTGVNGTTVTVLADGVAKGSGVVSGGTYSVTVSALAEGVRSISATATNAGGTSPASASISVTIDTTGPSVTVNQAVGQADPTNATSINFTAVFSESVTGLSTAGISVTGTAGGTKSGPRTPTTGATYALAITGHTGVGTVIASVLAGAAQDTAGNLNLASTSTDNTVTYDAQAPTLTAVSSTNGNGNLQVGDVLTFTFSEAMATPATTTTVGLSRTGNGAVSMTIPGVLSGSTGLGSSAYLAGTGTRSATLNASVTVTGTQVKVTVLATPSPGDATGTDTTLRAPAFAPAAALTDLVGNAAAGTFTPPPFVLF